MSLIAIEGLILCDNKDCAKGTGVPISLGSEEMTATPRERQS